VHLKLKSPRFQPNVSLKPNCSPLKGQAETLSCLLSDDTGINVAGEEIVLTEDALGALKQAAEEGKKVESLASDLASANHVSYLSQYNSDLSSYTTIRGWESRSLLSQGYEFYDGLASIARERLVWTSSRYLLHVPN